MVGHEPELSPEAALKEAQALVANGIAILIQAHGRYKSAEVEYKKRNLSPLAMGVGATAEVLLSAIKTLNNLNTDAPWEPVDPLS